MKLSAFAWYAVLIIGTMACAAHETRRDVTRIYQEPIEGRSGYEIIIRPAEEPSVTTVRPLDKTFLLRTSGQIETTQETVQKEKTIPTNLRRRRLQLRRNRYLLLQDG